jgi:hypothetical protein
MDSGKVNDKGMIINATNSAFDSTISLVSRQKKRVNDVRLSRIL